MNIDDAWKLPLPVDAERKIEQFLMVVPTEN